jgi:hypothetical protein
MATYFIESTHTPETCLQALDEVLAKGPQALAGYSFGCAIDDHSNHVAFVMVEATDEAEARSRLPAVLTPGARVIKVGNFTPDQIASFHQS